MHSSDLTISNLSKRYGGTVALEPADLAVAAGEFLTLLGPSGSGKTTLLSLIAGLTLPDGGHVAIGGKDVTYTPPYERDIGVVFQNYALFPHMTVEENIAFPLKMRNVAAVDAARQVGAALEMVRLPHLAKRFPRELSGGQQQRVALARCMVYGPALVLMDEPLGALDKKLRDQMQLEIKRIHRETGTTVVYVTHDQEEAMTMSDRICLMSAGRIAQLGTPDALYFRPRSVFVADFLGESNLLPAQVVAASAAGLEVRVDGGNVTACAVGNGDTFRASQRIRLMVRPQNLRIVDGVPDDGRIQSVVTDVMVSGSLTRVHLQPLSAALPRMVAAYPTRVDAPRYAIGQRLALDWQPGDAVAVPEDPAT